MVALLAALPKTSPTPPLLFLLFDEELFEDELDFFEPPVIDLPMLLPTLRATLAPTAPMSVPKMVRERPDDFFFSAALRSFSSALVARSASLRSFSACFSASMQFGE